MSLVITFLSRFRTTLARFQTIVSMALFTRFTDYEYDSELEVSETQFETLETGEMSHDDESVSVLADRALPSASRVALRVAAQITGDEKARGFVPPSMNFEEHMINNCRARSKLRR